MSWERKEEKMTELQEKVAQIFNRAAEILETRGWCQHYMAVDSNGNPVCFDDERASAFCMNAAIILAEHELESGFEECNEGYRVRCAHLHEGSVWYNDAPGRTKEEVIAKLRELAQHASNL